MISILCTQSVRTCQGDHMLLDMSNSVWSVHGLLRSSASDACTYCSFLPTSFFLHVSRRPVSGAKVVMKGCVDYPISCETDQQGRCELGRALTPGAIPLNFCYENARHLCQWEVLGSKNTVYVPNQIVSVVAESCSHTHAATSCFCYKPVSM